MLHYMRHLNIESGLLFLLITSKSCLHLKVKTTSPRGQKEDFIETQIWKMT